MPKLYVPSDDIYPTPVASRKSPINRFNNVPPVRYNTRTPVNKTMKSNPDPDKPGPSTNGHQSNSSSEPDDSDEEFYPYKNERKSAIKNTCSPTKKTEKLNSEKPGPRTNGGCLMLSSLSDDSDGDSPPDKNKNKSLKNKTPLPTKKKSWSVKELWSKTSNNASSGSKTLDKVSSGSKTPDKVSSGNKATSGNRTPNKANNSDAESLQDKNKKKSEKSALNISESDFETDGSTSKSTVSNRLPYSKVEDEMIIEYLMVRNRLDRCRGNTLWQELEKSKHNINQRTYQSLRNRFLRQIKPLLLTRFRYLLKEDNIKMVVRIFPDLKGKNRALEQINIWQKPSNTNKVCVSPRKLPQMSPTKAKIPEKEDSNTDDDIIEIGEVVYNPLNNTRLRTLSEVENERGECSQKTPRKVKEAEKEKNSSRKIFERVQEAEKEKNSPRKISGRVEESKNKKNSSRKIFERVEESENEKNSPRKISGRVEEPENKKNSSGKISGLAQDAEKEKSGFRKISGRIEESENEKNGSRKISERVQEAEKEKNSPQKISGRVEESDNKKKGSRKNLGRSPETEKEKSGFQKISRRVEESENEKNNCSQEISKRVEETEENNSQKLVDRIEESDDESDLIKETPEEIILTRQKAKEKSPPKKSLEKEPEPDSADEETQLVLENLDVSMFPNETNETDNAKMIVDNDVDKNMPEEGESQSLCGPSTSSNKKLETEGIDTNVNALRQNKELLFKPLYRCSIQTRMGLNSVLNKLDRIVHKRKRRRKRRIFIRPAPQVEEEKEVAEDDSKAYIDEIVQKHLQSCQNLLSDSESENELFINYLKNMKSLTDTIKAEPESEDSSFEEIPKPKPSRLKKAVEIVTVTDTDTDTDSTSSKSSTKSAKKPRQEIRSPLEPPNGTAGLLNNMLKMLK